jgi:hypothetical protein
MNKTEKEEIESLKQEELREEHFWQGYSNKLKEQIRSENIFQEIEKFKTLKNKENKNFFKKILKTLGF